MTNSKSFCGNLCGSAWFLLKYWFVDLYCKNAHFQGYSQLKLFDIQLIHRLFRAAYLPFWTWVTQSDPTTGKLRQFGQIRVWRDQNTEEACLGHYMWQGEKWCFSTEGKTNKILALEKYTRLNLKGQQFAAICFRLKSCFLVTGLD